MVNCRHEGWRGFYKGLSANLVRVTPATVITFVVYENVSHSVREYRNRPSTDEDIRRLPILVQKVEAKVKAAEDSTLGATRLEQPKQHRS